MNVQRTIAKSIKKNLRNLYKISLVINNYLRKKHCNIIRNKNK